MILLNFTKLSKIGMIIKKQWDASHKVNLLMIVKTKSDVDNVWVSFIEGLHQHSGVLFCLTCSSFDYVNNEIKQGSLKMKNFNMQTSLTSKRLGEIL
jgi:hypothetical protein